MLTDDPVLLMTCVIIAASPSAVLVTVLAMQYGHDASSPRRACCRSTALSMLTIPLLFCICLG